jgi:DNA-binding transcriptional regulator PaaX
MEILQFLAKKRGGKKFPIFSVREIEDSVFGENETTTLTRNALRRIVRTRLVERPKGKTGHYRITEKALGHLKKLK